VTKSVIDILDIYEKDGVCYVYAKHFLNIKPFFDIPCSSEKIGIFVISQTSTANIKIPIMLIKRKCLKIKYLELDDDCSYITIPLQVTNNCCWAEFPLSTSRHPSRQRVNQSKHPIVKHVII